MKRRIWLLGLGVLWLSPAVAAAASPEEPPAMISEAVMVRVEAIRFEGNTVFDTAVLEELATPFLGRELAIEDLEDLRARITRHYTDAGYISSGALIPEQSVTNGTLTVKIVEGRLSAVEISGLDHLRESYLRREFMRSADGPLNVSRLQERMQVLLQENLVKQVNAELKPGSQPGESILRAQVSEGPRYALDLSVANDRPVSVGETGGALTVAISNTLGINDQLSVSAGITPGYENYAVSGRSPILVSDLGIFFSVDRSDGSVVEDSFRELDITSREYSTEAGLTWLLQRRLRQQLSFSASLMRTRTETYLLDQRFSFSPGVENGESTVSLFRQAIDWTYRGREQIFAMRTALDLGIDAFGSTIHPDSVADSQFVVLKSQAQYVRRVWDSVGEWVLRGELQLSSDNLLPAEKIAVGGSRTVRGFRENTLVRDEAAIASLEYRHRLAQLRIGNSARDAAAGDLALALFADAGRGRDRHGDGESLASLGGGLRWAPTMSLNAQIYMGFPFIHETSDSDESLQDDGIHFRVNYGTSF